MDSIPLASPDRIRAGLYAKAKGKTNAGQPNRRAARAVRIGPAPEREAAAKAAIATGGVIIDIIPKYRTKRCAAIGSIPSLTSAGATSAANNT